MSPGGAKPPLFLGDLETFLCRGTEAPAGSSVQGGARDDALGSGDSPFPWEQEAALLSAPAAGARRLRGHLRECGQYMGLGAEGTRLFGSPRKPRMLNTCV